MGNSAIVNIEYYFFLIGLSGPIFLKDKVISLIFCGDIVLSGIKFRFVPIGNAFKFAIVVKFFWQNSIIKLRAFAENALAG